MKSFLDEMLVAVILLCFIVPFGFVIYSGYNSEANYKLACDLQADENNGYTVYVDGREDSDIDISKLKSDTYNITIDKEKKEIILNTPTRNGFFISYVP